MKAFSGGNVYANQVIRLHLAILQNQLKTKGILLSLIKLCRFTPLEKPNYVLSIEKLVDFLRAVNHMSASSQCLFLFYFCTYLHIQSSENTILHVDKTDGIQIILYLDETTPFHAFFFPLFQANLKYKCKLSHRKLATIPGEFYAYKPQNYPYQ